MDASSSKSEKMSDRIIRRVERKLDNGENSFAARGVMASLALALSSLDEKAIISQTNQRIVELMESRKAEGAVYAERIDLGNGEQDTTDYVFVAKRNDTKTGVPDFRSIGRAGGKIVVRERTSGFDRIAGI